MGQLRVATVWLGGCAGCHMSFLDMDEFLIDLAEAVELVHSPIMDVKDFPENVDIAIVEGAVANEDNLHEIQKVRRNSRLLVALGDCAVTGNVPAMRNPLGDPENILHRMYVEGADIQGQIPHERGIVPALLPRVRPLHEVVPVDVFLQGCPPSAATIRAALEQLLAAESERESAATATAAA